MNKATVSAYRKDKYYSRVVRTVAKVLSRSEVVAPVDVIMEMGNLSKKNHDDCRHGRVPCLESVFQGNLSKSNRILRIIGFHAHDLNMVPKQTIYHQLSVRWLFSGLRGGRGKTEPGTTYIGGFGVGRAGQFFGKWSEGIIPSDNEETGWIEDKQESRERTIGILIRYLSAPIILLLAIIALSLLH